MYARILLFPNRCSREPPGGRFSIYLVDRLRHHIQYGRSVQRRRVSRWSLRTVPSPARREPTEFTPPSLATLRYGRADPAQRVVDQRARSRVVMVEERTRRKAPQTAHRACLTRLRGKLAGILILCGVMTRAPYIPAVVGVSERELRRLKKYGGPEGLRDGHRLHLGCILHPSGSF